MTVVHTASGRFLDVFNPNPDDILLEDIAQGLEGNIRWNNSTSRPISVAEHSLYCAWAAPHGLKLAMLMHDAAEAYLGDVAHPIKKLLPKFSTAEDNLLHVITNKFGGAQTMREEIIDIDVRMAWTEVHNLMRPSTRSNPAWQHMATLQPYDVTHTEGFDEPGMWLSVYHELTSTLSAQRN